MPKVNKKLTSNECLEGVNKPKIKKKSFHDQIQGDVAIPKILVNGEKIKEAIKVTESVKDFKIVGTNKTFSITHLEKEPIKTLREKTDGCRTAIIYFFQNNKRMSEILIEDTKTGDLRQGYRQGGQFTVQGKGNEAQIRPNDQEKTPRNTLVFLKGDSNNRTPVKFPFDGSITSYTFPTRV